MATWRYRNLEIHLQKYIAPSIHTQSCNTAKDEGTLKNMYRHINGTTGRTHKNVEIGPRLPVTCGDKDSILSGKGIRGQPLDVPVSHNSGLAQKCGKRKVRSTGNTQLTNLHNKRESEGCVCTSLCTISEPNIMSMHDKVGSMPS